MLLHGLGGNSQREGLRRLGIALLAGGFSVLRLNLRGADPGRHLANGTYAASCNIDLAPALVLARQLAATLPVFGAGTSLGGTILLNACLDANLGWQGRAALDALACISSPLDLAACSAAIEQPRNRIYQRWLMQRLVRQTLADPGGLLPEERKQLALVRSIRDFDAAITAPRWGFGTVERYYSEASPLKKLDRLAVPTLLLQALDDPWVPAKAACSLRGQSMPNLELLLTEHGGHNGFHGQGDDPLACWSDRQAVQWLQKQLG